MSKLYCASGWHHPYYCLCPITCDVCGISTNHTTEQHGQAEREQHLCISCGSRLDHDDDEVRKCRECLDEYWTWRREMYYDNLAKEEGGEG